jgi:hypothetical protein
MQRNAVSLIVEMIPLKNDSEKCIAILKSALDGGFKFADSDAGLLAQLDNTDVVKFYLDQGVPVRQLLDILSRSYNYPKITTVCLDHSSFPQTALHFHHDGGQTFGNFCRLYLAHQNVDTGEKKEYRVNYPFIKIIFEKYSDWLSTGDVSAFAKIAMDAYGKSKNEAEQKNARDALFLICQHPAYRFAESDEYVTNEQFNHNYPFYWAALHDDVEIFNLFYFHRATSDKARELAIERANKYFSKNVINELALTLMTKRMRENKNMLMFYMAMMSKDNALQFLGNNKDVMVAMMEVTMQADYYACLGYLSNNKLPFYDVYDEVQQPKEKVLLCLPPKASSAGFFAIETVANKISENDIFNIQAAAQRGIDNYKKWYKTGESYRGKSGLLAGINHRANGLERARELEKNIYHHPSQDVVKVINDFLKNSHFKNHSLSQFLLDQLVVLVNSPWVDEKKRYSKHKCKVENTAAKSLGAGKK